MNARESIAAVVCVAVTATPLGGVARAGGTNGGPSALDALVASERAFSALSVEKGMKEAFLTYLADDGLIFRPLAVNGKQVWQARKPNPATLIWEPSRAEVSGAGDLGWTTGPWEYRPPADSTGAPPPPDQIAHGHFTSVWEKQPNGEWRVVLDIGVSHAKPERGVGSGDFLARPEHVWARAVHKDTKTRTQLETIDQLFGRDARKDGPGAFDRWAAADVRVHREGAMPAEGRDAARHVVKSAAALVGLLPQGSRVAESDDLGYTYGIVTRASANAAPDSSVYLHLWRRQADQKWRLALDLENPLGAR